MSFHSDFIGQTDGIDRTAPVRWRRMEGATSVFWQARGVRGGRGYYLSQHPRIMVFLDEVSSIRLSNDSGGRAHLGRALPRVLYVPAGLPMWTHFTCDHSFAHLDLHLHRDRLLKMLTPAIGRSAALDVLARPVESEATRSLLTLAELLVEETVAPAHHRIHAETLAAGLVTGLLDLASGEEAMSRTRLTQGQIRKLERVFRAGGGRGQSVAEMAQVVGLSESWFTRLFRDTTGVTPLQWQLRQRVELAQTLLEENLSVAEIADRLGFSDQAHLTRVFRQVTGQPPGAWRRARICAAPPESGAARRA
ncbi:transcriptional regulator, AraC family [[Luteovulum] sphaeroides subsp. megalophilum]|uniref:helix-turn-helix domain-containing protein n=1 Tax=Cereibacter sphaeroides TaxID=1063 RepID=UPI000B716D0D|nr:AraC family transcriptional regulator [Cereibacter sphaeroides]SNS85082.1 transcriptional regulator, AraC family [[Luteovulum] sphaeroides subsp. megalophilum]